VSQCMDASASAPRDAYIGGANSATSADARERDTRSTVSLSAVDNPSPGASDSTASATDPPTGAPTLDELRERTLTRGVNPLLYWFARAILVPFFLLYFRLDRIGREHVPS